MNLNNIYGYIQSVFARSLYPTPNVPDLAGPVERLIQNPTITPVSYTLNSGDLLEVLLITDCVNIQYPQYSRPAILLAKVNPSTFTNLGMRYGGPDLFMLSDDINFPSYIHHASARVTATGRLSCQTVMFCRDPTITPVPSFNTIVNSTPKTTYSVPTGHEFWINAIPNSMQKLSFSANQIHSASISPVSYLVQINNLENKPITVTVAGNIVQESIQNSYLTNFSVSKSTPIRFVQYILEMLRQRYSFYVLNPNSIESKKTLMGQLKLDINTSINTLVNNWQNLLNVVPGFNLDDIINFIIFYL